MYNYNENYYQNPENISREIYDLDLNFGKHPISGDLRKKNGIEAIKQSIRTLILLNHYEKPLHPDIGCDIYKSMFEPFEGDFTTTLMEDHIHNVIDNYEPRVELNKIEIIVKEDYNSLNITIWFTPINEVDPVSMDIFLKISR